MGKRVLIIGAVAVGPKAASRLRRLDPSAEITMLDRGEYISFGGCGIPYYVSNEINTVDALRSTPYGRPRDPEFFRDRKRVLARNRCEALSIDRAGHKVRLRDLKSGQEEDLPYDKLVIATGSTPRTPPMTVVDDGKEIGNNPRVLGGVHGVSTLEGAQAVREACASGRVRRAVIVGGSFIGLEMAVALADMWGIETSLVELMPQLMPGVLSPSLAAMAEHDLRQGGVQVHTGEKVLRLEAEKGALRRVVTDKRELEADLLIVAAGFAPNVDLARAAGLDIDPGTRAILVNEHLQTSDPDIYAGGDCVAIPHLVTGQRVCLALGSLANRQGRVIGTNLALDQPRATFAGAVGTWAVKLFKLSFCGTGLTTERARAAGLEAFSASIEAHDRAHFYPDKNLMSLELVVEEPTRRVLGLQGADANGDAVKARIDAAATMLQFGRPTLDDFANAEVAYAPPFSAALDGLNVVANVAENILTKKMKAMAPKDFADLWDRRESENVWFLDARPAEAARATAARFPGQWHAVPLEECREHFDEIPRDRPVVAICNTGLRAYEVSLELQQAGFDNVTNSQGGMQALIKQGREVV